MGGGAPVSEGIGEGGRVSSRASVEHQFTNHHLRVSGKCFRTSVTYFTAETSHHGSPQSVVQAMWCCACEDEDDSIPTKRPTNSAKSALVRSRGAPYETTTDEWTSVTSAHDAMREKSQIQDTVRSFATTACRGVVCHSVNCSTGEARNVTSSSRLFCLL